VSVQTAGTLYSPNPPGGEGNLCALFFWPDGDCGRKKKQKTNKVSAEKKNNFHFACLLLIF
jgi:hypothetical protein